MYVFDRRQNASVLVARCLAFRFQFTTADIPQVSPRDAQFAGQMPGQRQAEADDAVRIALNTVDERTTEAFQRERSGDFQRLASGNVPFDVASVNSPKWTLAWLAPRTVRPVAKSIRQWPVHSSPVAPLMRFSRSRATASLCGLP